MKRGNRPHLSDAELVNEFVSQAKEAGQAVIDCESARANRALKKMWAVEDVLRERGPRTRLTLVPLLDDQDRRVRYYAAKHLLAIVPEQARAVIEEIGKIPFDALAGDAGMALYFLDAGISKPR